MVAHGAVLINDLVNRSHIGEAGRKLVQESLATDRQRLEIILLDFHLGVSDFQRLKCGFDFIAKLGDVVSTVVKGEHRSLCLIVHW